MRTYDKTTAMNVVDEQLIADSWDLVRSCQQKNNALFGHCENLTIGSAEWSDLTQAACANIVVIEKAFKTINVAYDRIEKRVKQ